MPFPLLGAAIAAVIGVPLLYVLTSGGKKYDGDVKAGDIVDEGSTDNAHGVQFNYRIIYTLNEAQPYVAKIKLAGFGKPEDGWEFVETGMSIEEARDKAFQAIANRPEGA
jgi:hypothetical protein